MNGIKTIVRLLLLLIFVVIFAVENLCNTKLIRIQRKPKKSKSDYSNFSYGRPNFASG